MPYYKIFQKVIKYEIIGDIYADSEEEAIELAKTSNEYRDRIIDVRRAIDLLRVAGELAEEQNEREVSEQDVKDAYNKIEMDRFIEVIKTLPTQSKAVLLACIYVFDSTQENITSNIYRAYTNIMKSIDADVLTQRRITGLLMELDQLGIINGFNEFRGRKGRKKIISSITSKDKALETLYEDFEFKVIKNVPPGVFLR